MARENPTTMLIYKEDMEFIKNSALEYPNIETGGDLFGLWQSESQVVVQLVIGPGKKCRRTGTSFFQDTSYLSRVGQYLTSAKGLCNIGEWHSHHSLNLPEPSGGDRATVLRNMPGQGLKRFLLIIATIKPSGPDMNGFMFTAPVDGSRHGGMIRMKSRILPGQNPFRRQRDVLAKLNEGAETGMVEVTEIGEIKLSKSEKRRRKKEAKKQKKQEKEDGKVEEKDPKKRLEKKQKKNKTKKPDKGKKNRSLKRFWPFGHGHYSPIPDHGGTSEHFSQNTPISGSDLSAHETNSQRQSTPNNIDVGHHGGNLGTPVPASNDEQFTSETKSYSKTTRL